MARSRKLSLKKSYITRVEVTAAYRSFSQVHFNRLHLGTGETWEQYRYTMTGASAERLVKAINDMNGSGRFILRVGGWVWIRTDYS